MANMIDNFTHGLAVGGSFMLSTRVGVFTTFAILGELANDFFFLTSTRMKLKIEAIPSIRYC